MLEGLEARQRQLEPAHPRLREEVIEADPVRTPAQVVDRGETERPSESLAQRRVGARGVALVAERGAYRLRELEQGAEGHEPIRARGAIGGVSERGSGALVNGEPAQARDVGEGRRGVLTT
ncbi:MAG: hypothetical protein CVU56_25175 [Deltaproteobacteria bacterium HGW-Deltaproteobacteria-14]|nr:MAG: hypothetical protein CVU56_25175 [Deltaproteobacteria bacterium HGW-Deltaproteobacteria-14]